MIKTISINDLHEVKKKLGKNELILDVRRPDEFADGHVPGAKNIMHEEVGKHADELKKYDVVYLYCRSGGRVQKAGFDLMTQGLKNFVLVVDGGMPDWIAQGYPVEK